MDEGSFAPWTEADRLRALESYDVLDTPAEADFDDLARIAAQICGTPMALISLVDARRQWFKSALGLSVSETPREIAFCNHAIRAPDMFSVEDASRDPRFAENPLVTGDPNLRFYTGAPLLSPEGYPLGTLCVLDTKPGRLTEAQRQALAALARQVVTQLELRKMLAAQKKDAELRQLLVQELQHRVKNTLTTVQAVVSQSLRNAASLEEGRETLSDRLFTMGKAHDIFTSGNWQTGPLADIAEAAISTGGQPRERYRIGGPPVELSARAALGIALTLHELNTNAMKFGALSNATGVVELSWEIEGDLVKVEWRETGGPPVVAPTRRGFGSRMIVTALAGEVRGTSHVDYRPEGLVWRLTAPLSGMSPPG